ncbi:hypothetical protein CWR48_10570 [Oceanobacillus arenosus]|uniref:CAAX prenyl protease 2/Lysostaphin resistance protein A-like domain-containing protein n=1 Tax=Oceanobacillus arenosus TaxID=1229153 RepID=A0A3D8PRL0_9BACI|nr:CPBP family intramembrane glutamic endopeptidase [Oceanobacillus arenosus]RDW18753.1 hypothetical protein CWR48_10570 [Oceanobacillus arenosus]
MLKSAWLVSFIRIPMLGIALLLLFAIFELSGLQFHFPFLPELSTVYFTVVNIICFILMHRLLKKEGRTLKELVGYHREYLFKDILYGLLWLVVLFVPFVLAVMGMMFILFGTEMLQQFQTVFAGNEDSYLFARPIWLMWFAAIVSLAFPFLNGPIEEIMYRGYAQSIFLKYFKKVWIAIFIPSLGFALQHIFLAATLEGALVYCTAYFLWGVGSGIIYLKQKRLFPLIICHFVVNISFSVFPIIFLTLGVTE